MVYFGLRRYLLIKNKIMANIIEFKYLNADTLDPICGLTVNYSVKVIAVLANTKGTEGQARGAAYTSDEIDLQPKFLTTDSNGIIEVDVTDVFLDSTFLGIWQKFSNLKNYNVSLQISLESEKQEIGPYMYISQTNIPSILSAYNVTYDKELDEYSYPDLQYWNEYSSFEIDEIVINEDLLKAIQSKKLKIQRDYTNSLQDFQNEINSQATLQIPVLNEYNPINITQIITRCLELSVGTIENALTFTTEAGLVGPTARLNKIKTLISQISNLYPEITIEDGEGIPYQNVGVIPEPFRAFGFFQEEGEIFATSFLMYEPKKSEECQPTIKISLNGMSFYEKDALSKSFIVNLSTVLSDKSLSLVDGDILDILVTLNCTNYNSKLIIKK
jgi:hypothetical protein